MIRRLSIAWKRGREDALKLRESRNLYRGTNPGERTVERLEWSCYNVGYNTHYTRIAEIEQLELNLWP